MGTQPLTNTANGDGPCVRLRRAVPAADLAWAASALLERGFPRAGGAPVSVRTWHSARASGAHSVKRSDALAERLFPRVSLRMEGAVNWQRTAWPLSESQCCLRAVRWRRILLADMACDDQVAAALPVLVEIVTLLVESPTVLGSRT